MKKLLALLLILAAVTDVWSGSTVTPRSGSFVRKELINGTTGTGSVTSTNTGPLGAGGYLVWFLSSDNTVQDSITSVVEGGNTFARLGAHSCNNGSFDYDIWGAQNTLGAAAGTTTVVSFAGTHKVSGILQQWQGIAPSSAFDIESTCATGSSFTPTTTTVTPTNPFDLCLAGFTMAGNQSGSTSTMSNGYTIVASTLTNITFSNSEGYIVDVLQNGSPITSTAWTAEPLTGAWMTKITCLKPSGSNAVGIHPL